MSSRIKLSDHFTYGRLLRYATSAIMMMIFSSIYTVVDGFFVSNYCGKTPFAALNLIYPLVTVISSVGFMFGTGGSAIVGITLGEGDNKRANQYFSMFVYCAIVSGVLFSSLGQLFLPRIAVLFGARGEMLRYSVLYARIVLLSTPALMLQMMFQTFFNTAEKPKYGLYFTLLSGFANMILDFLLVGMLRLGISGAAWATVVSEYAGGVLPIFYFARKNDSLLKLGKTVFKIKVFMHACWNGMSEFFGNICISIISILYNRQLLKYAGEDGVSAFGVIMYVYMLFLAIALGYAIAMSPIVSFHYGAGNKKELRNLLVRSTVILAVTGVLMFLIAEGLSDPIARIFVSYDAGLMLLTRHAFRMTSIAFLLVGFNIYASAFFTALGNGTVSLIIEIVRSFILQLIFIMVMPALFGVNGVWYAFVTVEICSTIVTAAFLIAERKRYGYLA